MSKKVTERSRRSREVNNVPKERKVAKTGAERIRAYRARIMALENAAAARSATKVEGMVYKKASQQNLAGENKRSLLYEALSRQSTQDEQEVGDNHRQFVVQMNVHQQDSPFLSETPSNNTMEIQYRTKKVTKLRIHSKIAKSAAERARAYRERKKALKKATNQQLTTHSHVEDAAELEKVSLEAINAGTSRSRQCGARQYELVVEPLSSPSTPGSSNSGVESSVAASVHYKPTLWYYKHLNFLSGNEDPDSDDSDSEPNEDTVYVQIPRGQKRPASTSIDQDIESDTSIDTSAAAFGRSVGAQLHHLSKMQRCIAEKLISDVIYHAKMEQLSLDSTINVKEAADDQVNNILIPKAGPSWYDTDTALETGEQESSSSCTLHNTTEDLVKKEIAETESAVNFIQMERDDTENYYFQDDEEQNHAIDIIKEELM